MGASVPNAPEARLAGRQGGAVIAVLALGAILATAAMLAPFVGALEVREERTGRLVYLARVPAGGRFEVRFVHSVERTPVCEVFAVESGGVIYLVETRYKSFGAGLPTIADEGARFALEDGEVRITGIRRRIGELDLAVSPVPGHSLVVSGKMFAFADVARPGTALNIKAVRAPMAAFLFRGRCWWIKERTMSRETSSQAQATFPTGSKRSP
ncbi:MAG: DUF1850 domain-containing protein [Firmicutes bacterium]|jgi:hypothetical protein|nr:DUF1850 domain-containing protein [Bacillota bacterium]MDH7494486.1 DUF1850 domain-containing protein [Bacillota bacterium]